MKDSEVLIVEISGKRPGDSSKRLTERLPTRFDHLIISNDSTGYETDWAIANVPQDYREYYIKNHKVSENAWYAPMNRSYAIKYAKERGYKYLIQLDDNIYIIALEYKIKNKLYRTHSTKMFDDFVEMLICILENTNACMSGMRLVSMEPSHEFLSERYVYSFLALKLSECPDVFYGGFEDDIEYRLKCAEKGLPVIMCCPMAYGKTSQVCQKDETGNRAAYTDAGINRGKEMRKIHGDVYSCGLKGKTASTRGTNGCFFRHQLKPFKVGVIVYDMDAIKKRFSEMLKKYGVKRQDRVIIKEK